MEGSDQSGGVPGEDAGYRNPRPGMGDVADAILAAADTARIGVTLTFMNGGAPENAYLNDVAVEILGYTREELLSRPPMLNLDPAEVPRLAAMAATRLRGETTPPKFETVVVQSTGKRVPIDVSVSHVTIEGRPAVVAFFADITKRKEAEAALLESESRFRTLIERAPDGIAITRDARYVYVNPAALKVLGFEKSEELLGQSAFIPFEEEGHERMRTRAATMLATGVRFPPQEYGAIRTDGRRVSVELTSLAIEYEGSPAILVFARDVTERRQLEAQLAQADRLRALGTLAAGVAHEINNPLAFTRFTIELLERLVASELTGSSRLGEAHALLTDLRHGTDRMGSVLRDLRSFARADEAPGPIDLREVLEAAERVTAHEIRHRATLTIVCDELPPVRAHRSRLEQVFVNLLLNAAQSFEEGDTERNRIVVRATTDAPQSNVAVDIEDNGRGIPAGVLGRIFDPFFTTKPVGVGTGLGLSICHSIVSQAGGEIKVESEIGHGTKFRVTLPTEARAATMNLGGYEAMTTDAARDAANANAPMLATSIGTAVEGGAHEAETQPRAKLLLVDDEPALARTLKLLLSEQHDVIAVTTGREALELLLSDATFDLVLCDLMMPQVTGMDIHARLVAERPQMVDRLVFMTGGAFTARASEFLKRVTNPRLEKPFSTDAVEKLLQERLQRDGASKR